MFKQAGKLNAENKDKGLHNDDDEEPQRPNTGGQKKFPPQVKTVNMIYATHIPKRERKRALRDVYAMEPVAPKFNPWSACRITFDRRDHLSRPRCDPILKELEGPTKDRSAS